METTKNKSFWRTDSKALIGSVILGVVMVLASQAAGVVDNLLPTGKAGMLIVNGAVWAIFTGLVPLIYKQPAGLITSVLEALLSIFYSPLWISIIFANVVCSLLASFVAQKFEMDKLSHHFIAQFFVNYIGNIFICIGLVKIFGAPLKVAVIESLIVATVDWVVASIATKYMYDGIKKSGLVK